MRRKRVPHQKKERKKERKKGRKEPSKEPRKERRVPIGRNITPLPRNLG